MKRLEIAPFSDEHLEGAATLLAERHARHRVVAPLLPARFEDPAAAREELEAAWHRQDASGAAALRRGRLVGYLVGAPRDDSWGANVWVEQSGHAVEEAETARDLYASAASRWVEEGQTRHYVLLPATDPGLLEAWYRLSFGQQHAHGIREVAAEVDVELPAGFEIRPPDAQEVEALIDLDLALPEHQRQAPVFSTRSLPTRDESRAEWISTLAGDEETILIGARDGRPVACWAIVPLERSREHRGLLRPEGASFLGFAVTLPEARGSGIGVALTNASLASAAKQGYATMATDWRVTNLLASRFWPRRGFRETFLRLYRSIP
jgi:ribosomal protein S18 acetylase RimI-like enzyme